MMRHSCILGQVLAFALFLPALFPAEDIKLANGGVLRNVTVNRINADGVMVTPDTFGASATLCYWRRHKTH